MAATVGPAVELGADLVGVEVGDDLDFLVAFAFFARLALVGGSASTMVDRGVGVCADDASEPATYAAGGIANAAATTSIHHFTASA
ncbi:MAG: hypothetical protein QM655_14350 [Nocardioidaceae bacterium]